MKPNAQRRIYIVYIYVPNECLKMDGAAESDPERDGETVWTHRYHEGWSTFILFIGKNKLTHFKYLIDKK